ncbi:MAG: hypothetical protein ACTSUE_01200, partial [Promethearchaeota archaeon]
MPRMALVVSQMVEESKRQVAEKLGVPYEIIIPVDNIILAEDLKRELAEKDKELAESKREIAEKDKKLAEKDETIKRLMEENKKLAE